MMNVEQTREHALTNELTTVNFLDVNGNRGAVGQHVHRIHLVFIGGKEAKLTSNEFGMLSDVQFKLRPMQNHS